MDKDLILTCDTGTTGVKCTLFNPKGEALFSCGGAIPPNIPIPTGPSRTRT